MGINLGQRHLTPERSQIACFYAPQDLGDQRLKSLSWPQRKPWPIIVLNLPSYLRMGEGKLLNSHLNLPELLGR
jgi:hypothetical protein